MRRLVLILFLIFSTGDVYAQNTTPQIITFTSHIDSVDRVQLRSSNSYVLVSWRVDDRPANANLVFEQILPDGTLLNIELPRLFWWVDSVGIGFVNLVYPGDSINAITLRLSVVNTAKDVLAYRELHIQIEDNLARPQIDSFYANVFDVSLQELRASDARIEVGWFTSNRTEQMNLVFEQVLPNGNVVNVELPRPHIWVNSEGSGITAPIYPGDGVAHVHLQVRLYLLNSNETLDTRTIFVPIQEHIQVPGPTPTLSTIDLFINRFDVTPALAFEGDALTISWDVSGLNTVSIGVDIGASQLVQQYQNQSNIGTMTVNAPLGVKQVRILIYANNITSQNQLADIIIPLSCRFSWMNGYNDEFSCPKSEPQTVQATYQAFERGYMILRADTGMFWIYNNDTALYKSIPDFTTNTDFYGETPPFNEIPPAGLYQPMNAFLRAWLTHRELGWAISPEQGYTITYQQQPEGRFKFTVFTLPDGTHTSGMIPSF